MMIVQHTSVINITGSPLRNHSPGVIARLGSPASLAIFSEMETMKTLAVEPRCVPLPPMPTPAARPQRSGVTLMPWASILTSMGSMAAVNGMLSMAAERIAETHISIKVAISKSLCA